MRILMISPINPYPANTGGLVRITQLFEGLSRFHEVTLAAPQPFRAPLSTPLPRNASIITFPDNALRSIRVLRSVLGCWPYHARFYYSEMMNRGIQEILCRDPYSLIYCHFIYTLPYVKGIQVPVVVDQHNVDRQYWVRKVAYYRRSGDIARYWFSRINLWRTIRFENTMLRYASGVVSVSKNDAEETRKFAPTNVSHFLVAPNGVDTTRFVPAASMLCRPSNELVIGFLGSLDLELNQRAAFTVCKEILPRVRSRLADMIVSALIIGRNPPKELRQYAQNNPQARLTVTGTVEDVVPYLQKLDVMVLPLDSGAGTKLRVLEAMSTGVCVVGTGLALTGIEGLVPGKHAILAESVEEFEVAICNLARDPDLRQRMARSARELVERQFGWDAITSELSLELAKLYSAPFVRDTHLPV